MLSTIYFFPQEHDAFKPVNEYFTLQLYAGICCAMEFEIHTAAGKEFNLSTDNLHFPPQIQMVAVCKASEIITVLTDTL